MKIEARVAAQLVEFGSGSGDNFSNYRQITAKRAGPASCGGGTHTVKVGDTIGWNPRTGKTQCAACWKKWSAENAEADAMERGYMSYGT